MRQGPDHGPDRRNGKARSGAIAIVFAAGIDARGSGRLARAMKRLSPVMKKYRAAIAALVFAGAFALAIAVKGPTPTVAQAAKSAPDLIAASFTSAWCSACRILEPRLARAMPAFADRAVEFVEFDFTFGETEALADLAAAHNLTRLYEANKGATGFTVLVNARSGAIVDTLTMNFTAADIERAIDRALKNATHTDDGFGRRSADL